MASVARMSASWTGTKYLYDTMQASLLLVLGGSLAGVANAAPAAIHSICHVLTYSGACGNLTSLSKGSSNSTTSINSTSSNTDSCTFSSICLVPSTCNSTLLTGSIDTQTGNAILSGSGNDTLPTNTTGCVSFSDFGMQQMDSLAVCDGNRYLIDGTNSAYQCICNDMPDSCPQEGTAVSVSYANGTSSTSAVAPGQPSQFSWTWGASNAPAPTTASPSSGMNASASSAAARTTFTFTFGGNTTSPTGASSATAGIGGVPRETQNNAATGAAGRLTTGLSAFAVSVICIFGSQML